MFKLGRLSLVNLNGVHPDLVRVVKRAIQLSEVDFRVIEGLRTLERQKQLVASGASTTLKSRHLTGHAVDLAALVGDTIRWDWPLYYKIADAVQKASKELNIPITSGSNWKSFPDGPHHELSWEAYP